MTINEQIEQAALAVQLDPALVSALVSVESAGNQWAWNPEPQYRYLWDVKRNAPFRALSQSEIASKVPPADFPTLAGDRDQEFWAQQASWGLMQIMGAVAREIGFRGDYLTQLCQPEANLLIGCKKLSQLLVWANGNVTQALAAWNGGKGGNTIEPFRNQAYADKVTKELRLHM